MSHLQRLIPGNLDESMLPEPDLIFKFGAGGNSQDYLGDGWSPAEPEFAWGIGAESHLSLPRGEPGSDYCLTLDVVPFLHEPKVPRQTLVVAVNGAVIGSCMLSRPTLLSCRIPAGVAERQDRLMVNLKHPNAARPSDYSVNGDTRPLAVSVLEARLSRCDPATPDHRRRWPPGLMVDGSRDGMPAAPDAAALAAWVSQRTGLTLEELTMRFESLGEGCEFGLVQRRCNAEPLGLLRFSATFLRDLIRGLDNGFDGLGKLEDVDARLEGDGVREYMIHEQHYGIVYHTFVYEGQRAPELVRGQEATRLRFLRRKFMEELQAAEKIFVYKRSGPVSEIEMLPLFKALRRHGPNTLLWVVQADRDHPPGSVEVVADGWLKAYIDRLAPGENAHALSFEGWIRVCANAVLLSRLQPAGGD